MTDDEPWVGEYIDQETIDEMMNAAPDCVVCSPGGRVLYVKPNDDGTYNWYAVTTHELDCPMIKGNPVVLR